MTTALERVEISRTRLRSAMLPPRVLSSDAVVQRATWLQGVKDLPVIGVVLESLNEWWAHHPLRAVGNVLAGASDAAVKPIAQRHPYALMLVAGVAGAMLVWRRPWRWIFSSAVFAGLLPRLASHAMSKLPVESWITMLSGALSQPVSDRPDVPIDSGNPPMQH